MKDLGKLAAEAEELLAGGFGGVKLRLGYPTLAEDLAAVRAVRKRIGPGVALMVDYNQALGVAEALERGRMLDAEGVAWIEEPIRHDDYRGAARLARELATPVQIGENFSLVHAMDDALEAGACDLVMPDLERIGGVTGWMRAASARRCARHPDVIAPLSRGERAPARRDTDGALARVRGLGRTRARAADRDRGRRGRDPRAPRQRHELERGGGNPLPHGLSARR